MTGVLDYARGFPYAVGNEDITQSQVCASKFLMEALLCSAAVSSPVQSDVRTHIL